MNLRLLCKSVNGQNHTVQNEMEGLELTEGDEH